MSEPREAARYPDSRHRRKRCSAPGVRACRLRGVRLLFRALFLVGASVLSAATAAAYAGAQETGAIAGRVVDAATLQPLPGAVVRLRPVEDGGAGRAGWATAADSAGEYRFPAVPAGSYQLRISRLGYLPAHIQVELRGEALTRISAGLEVEPVKLAPLE